MKRKTAFTLGWIFGLLGLMVAVFGVYAAFHFRNAPPVMLRAPAAAETAAENLMDTLCTGDYTAAGAYFVGNPDLGSLNEDASHAEKQIWDAFVQSMTYSVSGELYASDSGVALNVEFTALEIPTVTARLKDRSRAVLNERVEAAEDVSEIYDEHNNYRESFVMDCLNEAVTQAIAEDGKTRTETLTLNLLYQNGSWRVLPEGSLLSALSGWTA